MSGTEEGRTVGGPTTSPSATVVMSFHRTRAAAEFLIWVEHMEELARNVDGYIHSQISILDSERLDWALAATFETEDTLHRWLDHVNQMPSLSDAGSAAFLRKCSDVVVTQTTPPPPGVAVFLNNVESGREAKFIDEQIRLVQLAAAFPGFEGATVLRPSHEGREWLSVMRFRTDHQLQSWLGSRKRQGNLPRLRAQLTEDFAVVAASTPLGSVLRTDRGVSRITPKWKTAMLVLLVLYPSVMVLSRFADPMLRTLGTPPWLTMWLSQVVSVSMLTWVLMPTVTKWFRRWLDPVDGADRRTSLIGSSIIAGGYAGSLAIFASVSWLQFWN